MRFRVLGPVSYGLTDGWASPSGALRQRLLGALLAHPGHAASFDALTEALWPERVPERSRERLHVHVHRLRRELGDHERIAGASNGYQLVVEPGELDAERFEAVARLALREDGLSASDRGELARSALLEWPIHASALAYDGLDDVPVCRDERERLRALQLDVAELSYRLDTDRGRHLDVLPDLSALAHEHPLRESLQAVLMRALHQAGRQDEALRVFRTTRARLVAELGLEPSELLQKEHSLILAGPRAESDRVPAQLPTAVRLVGRDDALASLDELLLGDGDGRLVAICGPPGVGKSALALAWADRNRSRFPGGQLFVDLRGFSPATPVAARAALDGFVRALGGVPDATLELSEQAAGYRSMLADQRVLLVLDNARDAEQVRPLLPGAPGCRVLVTSRDTLNGLSIREGATRIGLPPLEPDHAIELLRGRPGADADHRWHTLARRCDYLPLTLRLAAERVHDDPGVLDRLADPALDGPERLQLWDSGDPETSAREVFSWSLRGLSESAVTLFRALGAVPSAHVATDALAALTEMDGQEASRALDTLVRAHLAEVRDGWVRQHDLLAAYAQEQADGITSLERDAMRVRLARRYAELVEDAARCHRTNRPVGPFSTTAQASAWLSAALGTVADVASTVPPAADEAVVRLSQGFYRFTAYGGDTAAAVTLHGRAVAAAERLEDLIGGTHALSALSSAAGFAGNIETARGHLEAAHDLAERSDDPVSRARLFNTHGNFLCQRGDLLPGLAMLRRSLEEWTRVGDVGGIQVASANIGWLLVLIGRLDEAEQILPACVEQVSRPDGDPVLLPFTLCDLGGLRLQQDALEAATDLARQAQDAAARSRISGADGQVLEGMVALRAGAAPRARAILEAALAAARAARDVEPTVYALIGLGRAQRTMDPDAAHEALAEALTHARRMGMRDLEGYALRAAADLLSDAGRSDAAVRRRAEGAAILASCGVERPLVPLV